MQTRVRVSLLYARIRISHVWYRRKCGQGRPGTLYSHPRQTGSITILFLSMSLSCSLSISLSLHLSLSICLSIWLAYLCVESPVCRLSVCHSVPFCLVLGVGLAMFCFYICTYCFHFLCSYLPLSIYYYYNLFLYYHFSTGFNSQLAMYR